MSPVQGQSGAITLSAWGRQLTVDKASDPRIDRFFTKYVQGSRGGREGEAEGLRPPHGQGQPRARQRDTASTTPIRYQRRAKGPVL